MRRAYSHKTHALATTRVEFLQVTTYIVMMIWFPVDLDTYGVHLRSFGELENAHRQRLVNETRS